MTWRHVLAVARRWLTVSAGCAHPIAGTATWPGARLEKVVLTAADLPAGVQYDRIDKDPAQPDGAGSPPTMVSRPRGLLGRADPGDRRLRRAWTG